MIDPDDLTAEQATRYRLYASMLDWTDPEQRADAHAFYAALSRENLDARNAAAAARDLAVEVEAVRAAVLSTDWSVLWTDGAAVVVEAWLAVRRPRTDPRSPDVLDRPDLIKAVQIVAGRSAAAHSAKGAAAIVAALRAELTRQIDAVWGGPAPF